MTAIVMGLLALGSSSDAGAPLTPEYREIVQSFLAHAPAPGANPQVIFMAGGFGSGKSTVRKQLAEMGAYPENQFVVIDADEIRDLVPGFHRWVSEYGIDEAIGRAKEGAIALSEAIREEAFARGLNIVLDQSLRNSVSAKWALGILRAHPRYRSTLVYVDTAPPAAIPRVESRKAQTGRGAPLGMVLASHEGARITFESLKDAFGIALEVRNNQAPELIAVTEDGRTREIRRPLREGLSVLGGGKVLPFSAMGANACSRAIANRLRHDLLPNR